MGKGQPTAETIRIRKMVRIERLKIKIKDAEGKEQVRHANALKRIQKMQAELDGLMRDFGAYAREED